MAERVYEVFACDECGFVVDSRARRWLTICPKEPHGDGSRLPATYKPLREVRLVALTAEDSEVPREG
jgi:hypothetical protein